MDDARFAGKLTRPADIEFANLGQLEVPSLTLEPEASKGRRLAIASLLERRIVRAVLPEVDKCGLQCVATAAASEPN